MGISGVIEVENPEIFGELEVRFIQPYQAKKSYDCPGCNRSIDQGMGHVVVVPVESPDLRRHWHKGCWSKSRV